VEGGSGGLAVSGVSRNRGSFVKCVAIQKRLGIPILDNRWILRMGGRAYVQTDKQNDRFARYFTTLYQLMSRMIE
jgi:hypothetical protein